MYLLESPDTNLKRYMPEQLSECDSRQYIEFCQLIFEYMGGKITFAELKTHAVYRLLNMVPAKEYTPSKNPKLRKIQEQEHENKMVNVYLLSERVGSFFEPSPDDENIHQAKLNFINNPVPKFRPAFRTFYGPTDQFMNVTFGEYRDALRLFHQFNATPDIEILYELAAIMYRPKKPLHFIQKHLPNYNGDVRQAYNPNFIARRSQTMRLARVGFVYGFYLLLASFQKFISTAKINWGGREIDFSILYQSFADEQELTTDIPDVGVDSIMFTMAESGTFGSIKELEQTSIWMIYLKMYDIRKKYIEEREQHKKAQNNDNHSAL